VAVNKSANPPNLETNEKKTTWIFDFKKAVTKKTAFFCQEHFNQVRV